MNIRNESDLQKDVGRIQGKYSGEYRRQGQDSLVRITDGLWLVIGYRGKADNPRSSDLYLVDKTPVTGGYLSNLYGQEFDDRVHRYRIEQEAGTDPPVFRILVLCAVKSRQKGRGRTANV